MRPFKTYKMWQDSVDVSVEIYDIVRCFPRIEQYGLADQLKRAAVSIPSNIAEGASRVSEKEFSHFLQISIGSCFEVETQMIIAQRLNYISMDTLVRVQNELYSIQKQIYQMVSVLCPIEKPKQKQ